MKKEIFAVIILLFTVSIYAQIDNKQESTKIPAVKSDSSIAIKPLIGKASKEYNPNVTALNAPKIAKTLNRPKKEFSMFGEKFGNPGELYVKQLDRHLETIKLKEKASANGTSEDQYFGDFKTDSEFIQVIYRDHEYPDGDRIRVLVNEDVTQPNILLTQEFKGFKLNLIEGFNKIDFHALNQGTSGPNTAEFHIYDDKGKLISANRWNLSTGFKGTIIIVKE